MYILIKIGVGGGEHNIICSKRKNKLVKFLKDKNYYYSKKFGVYINDKNAKQEGSSEYDYYITKIDEI